MAQRNEGIDFCKGLLILGVVYGHTVTAFKGDAAISVWLHLFVRTFDMPLFMLLSGFFLAKSLAKSSPRKMMMNRTSQILFPVLLWNVLFYLLSVLLFQEPLSGKMMMGNLTHLWFLWAVWVSSILSIGMTAVSKNKAVSVALWVMLVAGLHFIPHSLWNLAYMLPFFVIGLYYEELREKMSKRSRHYVFVIAAVVFVVCLCFWDGRYVVWHTKTYILNDPAYMIKACLYRFCIGLSGCIVMKTIYEYLGEWLKPRMSGLTNFVCQLGRNTLAIYILQSFVVEFCLKRWMGNTLAEGLDLYQANVFRQCIFGYVIAPLSAVALTYAMDLLARGLKKIPFLKQYVFGFKCVA